MRATQMIRAGLTAIALLATNAATAQESYQFQWPDNPFAPTLSDDLFAPTNESRFNKAGRVLVESLGGIDHEMFQIASYPLRDPATFGAFALGIGGLMLVDRQTTTAYQEIFPPIGEQLGLPSLTNISFLTADEEWTAAAMLGTYAYGIAANDERAQVAALLSAKAVAYSYLTSHIILKAALGRKRPVKDLAGHSGDAGVYTTEPFDFFNWNGIHLNSTAAATGMPSYHFTMYFATARVYSGVYDNYLIPYALAGALALQSAEGHNHWVSDMVAGALIGTGIGNVVLNSYEDRKRESLGTFTPMVSSEGVGLNWQMSF
ncbi:MAG: phosphatase PAP2 family protein [Maritimibacter sp.]